MKRGWRRWVPAVLGLAVMFGCTLAERDGGKGPAGTTLPGGPAAQTPTPVAGTSTDRPAEATAAERAGGYHGEAFSFDIPEGWSVHEGPSGGGKNAENYFNLGLNILVEMKGADYLPEVSVTDREIPPGYILRQVFHETYAGIEDQINQVSETEAVIDGRAALVKRYNRPWGEPWYTFQDAWVEVDGKIYVVACLLRLNPEPDDLQGCETVLDSLRFVEQSGGYFFKQSAFQPANRP